MNTKNLILVESLCIHYEVELSFFRSLDDVGIIELTVIDDAPFVAKEKLTDLEKVIRLHRDLDLDVEAIEIILDLLQKVNALEAELKVKDHKLKVYTE